MYPNQLETVEEFVRGKVIIQKGKVRTLFRSRHFFMVDYSRVYLLGLEKFILENFSQSTIEKSSSLDMINYEKDIDVFLLHITEEIIAKGKLAETIDSLRAASPHVKVILYTSESSIDLFPKTVGLVYDGYFLLSDSPDTIRQVIYYCLTGKNAFSKRLIDRVVEKGPDGLLSGSVSSFPSTESTVLAYMLLGYEKKEVFRKLGMNKGQGDKCIRSIVSKLML